MAEQSALRLCFVLVSALATGGVASQHSDRSIHCLPCVCKQEQGVGLTAQCSSRGLTSIPSTIPHSVNYLILRNNPINYIYPALQHFTNLTYLDLSQTDINTLHVDSFVNNLKLKVLNLHDDSIPLTKKAYPKGLFRNQKVLVRLNLGKNADPEDENMSYPDETLSDLISLKSLTIDGLINASFGGGFARLKQLTNLTLSGHKGRCIIRHLSNATFRNLKNIRFLDVSHCFLLDIDKMAFQPLRNIQLLNISDNQFLRFDTFGHSMYGLRNSSIRIIDASKIVPRVAIGVELRVKHVSHLYETQVRHVYFDNNRLELIDSTVPNYFPHLESLSLKGNRFTFGLYLLSAGPMKNLKVIYADGQYPSEKILQSTPYIQQNDRKEERSPLSALPDSVNSQVSDITPPNTDSLLDILGTIEISQNNVYSSGEDKNYMLREECPQDYSLQTVITQQQTYLKLLASFHSLHFKISIPENLRYISVSSSRLAYEIPQLNFSDNVISTIDLSNNLLTKWHGPIYPVDHLKFLDLSKNFCDYISPAFFENIFNLSTLNISQNYLSTSLANDTGGELFKNLGSLTTLTMTHNNIGHLPNALFMNLHNLIHLNLSWNLLSDWTLKISHLIHLQVLDLSNNRFEEMPKKFRDQLDLFTADDHPVHIFVKGNSLKCDCTRIESLEWMLQTHVNFTDLEETSCDFENHTSVFLTNLEEVVVQLRLHCKTIVPMIIGVVAGFLFFMFIVTAGIVYRYRWKLRYLYYTTRRKYKGYQRLTDGEDNFIYDAFVSYADEDRTFVVEDMRNILEKNFGLRLCIHHRDFMVGQAVTENIINAIQSSRRTVILLSPNFLKSSWCKYEAHMARFESIYTGRDVLCVVWYADLKDNRDIPSDLLEEIVTGTYLKYTGEEGEHALFWQNLRDAVSR